MQGAAESAIEEAVPALPVPAPSPARGTGAGAGAEPAAPGKMPHSGRKKAGPPATPSLERLQELKKKYYSE